MLKLNDKPDELMLEWIIRMTDEKADTLLVEKVAYEMRRKLIKKRKDGKRGWHTPCCSNKMLLEMLKTNIEKGDMVDVINLAGMILCRTSLYGESA